MAADPSALPKIQQTAISTVQDGIYTVAMNSAQDLQLMADYNYPTNYVRTTKYTLLSFIPVNLYHQFKRFYNLYFLVAACLSLVPNASAISPVSQIFPLVVVLLATMIKDGFEDWYRYKSDKTANNMEYSVVKNGKKEQILSKEISAGDIIHVSKGQQFPCDLMLLSSSLPDGVCFVETSQLDGETNLKRRFAIPEIQNSRTDAEIAKISGRIECDMPNNRLNAFNGRFILHAPDGEDKVVPLSPQQLLLRGAQLKNTDFVYGICVYAGVDTKIYRNLKNSRLKFSTMQDKLNKLLIGIFAYNLLILLASILSGLEWSTKYFNSSSWYLFDGTSVSKLVGLQSMSYFILYTYTIPISLFVTLEIVRFFQAMYIGWDVKLTTTNSEGKVIATEARNSNLNEDLGRVEYIFSDKTGTLTRNVMKLAKWFVADMVFDEFENPGGIGKAIQNEEISEGKAKHLSLFGRCVALCHTAIVNYESNLNDYTYEVESPDESALLEGIRQSGIALRDRGKYFVKIDFFDKEEIYEVLDIIEFTSERRRMSIIVKTANGIHLYCKGADQMLMNILNQDENQSRIESTKKMLYKFSCEGLRTLVFAWTPLSEAAYAHFAESMRKARASLDDKVGLMSAAADFVESNLYLLGSSAIDDKLQDEVPETIEYLLKCDIKLWVLTGDKRETAVNIAKSCRLISSDMNVMMLEGTTEEECRDSIKEIRQTIEKRNNDENNALVITGETLYFVVTDALSDDFLYVAGRCHSVVCCRVSPIQKASVVRLVKSKLKKVTLSVGDGANDVSMIQAAHIGIGIVGMEGAQAVRASDYSIGQFKCLKDLIAVHGRYSNDRLTKVIFYSLYKNIAFITVCFWFGIYSGWSAWQFYEETFLAYFNVVFTSLPPVAFGIYEQDISREKINCYPGLYKAARDKQFFSLKNIYYYLLLPLWHSIVVFFGIYFIVGDGILSSTSYSTGYWMIIWYPSSSIMAIVMFKLILQIRWWPLITISAVLISFAIYLAFILLVRLLGFETDFGATEDVQKTATYYLAILLLTSVALLPDLASLFFYSNLAPTDADILREESAIDLVVDVETREIDSEIC